MIKYAETADADLIDAVESLAYRVLHYMYPTWHSIPEEDVVQLLREEGIHAFLESEEE